MKKSGCKFTSFAKAISVLAVGFIVFISSAFSALAFDSNYVGNSGYWNDKGTALNIENGSFSGQLKYIIDEDNGCAYFYLTFYDSSFTASDINNVRLIFTVKNSLNSYTFSVGKSGLEVEKGNVDDNLDVYYDFSKLKSSNTTQEIFSAFNMKNSQDKKLCSEISCEYTIGQNKNFDLFKSVKMDMLVTTTVKTTTTKVTTTKTTTTKTTTQKTTTTKAASSSTTTAKSSSSTKFTASTTKKTAEKSTAQSSTKFTPSAGTTAKSSASSATTKFSASANSASDNETSNDATQYEYAEESEQTQNAEEAAEIAEQSETGESTAQITQRSKSLSSNSKILNLFAALAFILGVIVILYALFDGKRQKETEAKEDPKTEEKDDKSKDEQDEKNSESNDG